MRPIALVASSLVAFCIACQPPPSPSTPTLPAPSPSPSLPALSSLPPGSPLATAKPVPLAGPFAALTDVCADCTIDERPLSGATGIDRIAAYALRSGTSYLAVHTKAGWFVQTAKVPTDHLMLSHHSPRGSFLELAHAVADSAGLRVTRAEGGANFIGGMGNHGSTSFVTRSWIHCVATDDGVSCTEPQAVFSESCKAPMDSPVRSCVREQRVESAAVKALLTRGWQKADGDRWVPATQDLPPARFREHITFDADGKVHVLVLAPNDAHYPVTGTWSFEGPDLVRLAYRSGADGGGDPVERILHLLAIDAQSMQVHEGA